MTRLWLTTVLGFALGFYVGLFVVVALIGNAAFNEALPNPWRLLIAIPACVSVAFFWAQVCALEGKRETT